MKKIMTLTIICLLASGMFTLGVTAQESSEGPNSASLQSIMHEMFSDTQLIAEGIFYEDFEQVKLAAKRIADHPTPNLMTKKKLVKYLGKDMQIFKSFDIAVHNLANNIYEAAQRKNMPNTISEYHKMIDGCQSCHSRFKQSVSKILSEK